MLAESESVALVLPGWSIITVTGAGLLYRDQRRVVCWIDFARCYTRWYQLHPEQPMNDSERVVGWRSTGRSRLLDVEFFAAPRVRFEFTGYAQRNALLLEPMRRFGWNTRQVRITVRV